jgi:hypothetical protein
MSWLHGGVNTPEKLQELPAQAVELDRSRSGRACRLEEDGAVTPVTGIQYLRDVGAQGGEAPQTIQYFCFASDALGGRVRERQLDVAQYLAPGAHHLHRQFLKARLGAQRQSEDRLALTGDLSH